MSRRPSDSAESCDHQPGVARGDIRPGMAASFRLWGGKLVGVEIFDDVARVAGSALDTISPLFDGTKNLAWLDMYLVFFDHLGY